MKNSLFLAGSLAVFAGPALAATISVANFTPASYAAAVGSGSAVVEDFESYGEGNVADGFSTPVGTFQTLGGTGSGGTVTNADFVNDGAQLALRDNNVYGRSSTTDDLSGDDAHNMFLDSNDTYGIQWNVSLGGSLFDKIVLTLTDASDVGAIMQIAVDGMTYAFSGQGNANTKLVEISFDSAVSSATVFFTNLNAQGGLRLNDGFSIDDIAISEVPLPASALLLLAGLAGMAGLGRRRAG